MGGGGGGVGNGQNQRQKKERHVVQDSQRLHYEACLLRSETLLSGKRILKHCPLKHVLRLELAAWRPGERPRRRITNIEKEDTKFVGER